VGGRGARGGGCTVRNQVSVATRVLATALAIGCGDNQAARPADAAPSPHDAAVATCHRSGGKVAAVPVAQVFGAATLVASPPGDPRLFVLEQEGRIRIIANGEPLTAPFLDLRDNIGGPVQAGGEQGLLGLAFHPRFAENGLLFVYHSMRGANAVASYRVSADDRDRGDPASRQVVLLMADRFANHNGGMIGFGRDGMLYVATGDGGSANDPDGNGQNAQSLLGKMLRLDVDRREGGRNYAIPADNPFADGVLGAPEVFMTGLRNPWRWTFDGDTLFIGDVGQDRHEELDILPLASARGANLGWKTYEAMRCTGTACDPAGKWFPQLVRNHGAGAGNGWCSIIGGAVYRGTCSPELVGRYFYADYCKGGLFSLRWNGDAMVEDRQEPGDFPGKISSIAPGFGGELYVTTTDGGIFRLEGRP
jgi:glucose/arabinose dehydrogenase